MVTNDGKVSDQLVTSGLMDVTPPDSPEDVGARQPRDSIDGLTDNLARLTSHATLDLCSLPLSSSLHCALLCALFTVHCLLHVHCELCTMHCTVL